jgi:hypothetical protein
LGTTAINRIFITLSDPRLWEKSRKKTQSTSLNFTNQNFDKDLEIVIAIDF